MAEDLPLNFQESEFAVASELLKALDNRDVIDVGAELGSFIDMSLASGARRIDAFEPYPPNVEALRSRYAGADAVIVHDLALSDRDGSSELHTATDPRSREAYTYHHSLVEFETTATVAWSGSLQVEVRSLGGLMAEGLVPAAVGVLKVDTDGHDLAVLRGLGDLHADVIMAEYWDDIPEVYGVSPYGVRDLVELLKQRGFSTYAVFRHNEEFRTVDVNVAHSGPNEWGNVIWLHDTVRHLEPVLWDAASA